jgi:hypothetical protein
MLFCVYYYQSNKSQFLNLNRNEKTYYFIFILILSNKFIFSNYEAQLDGWRKYSFSSTKTESTSVSPYTRTYFRVAPNIGYFFIDKFAAGIKGLVNHEKTGLGSASDKQTYYGIGPFARYYFLPIDRQINVFSEGNYQHYILNPGNEGSNSYNFLLGTVVFFNSSVGLELTAGYSLTNYTKSDLKYKIFQLGLGFQIHLEKDTQ